MRPHLPFTLVAVCLFAVAAPALAAPRSRLVGRVFERGSAVALEGAYLETTAGESTNTDAEGRFRLDLAAGHVELVVTAAGYEPLKVVEELPPNTVRTVEYRLMPMERVDRDRYTTKVKSKALPHEGQSFTLRDEELQHAPGAGDNPMRVIASLPGVIAPIPVLPIYVVRGGSPGMNGFFLDGMRVPQLFHLVFVDGVVHPSILDRLDFYPGSFDATFGRYASGVVDATTRPGRTDAPAHGEVQLKLYDVSALAEVKLPDGASILAAGRYGYPAPIISLVQPGVDLSYWDYQLRLDWRGLTVEAIGSYDSLSFAPAAGVGRPAAAAQLLVEFHRVQVRERVQRGRLQVEAALVGGIDQMAVLSGQGVEKLGLYGRVAARLGLPHLAIAAGLDGELSRFSATNFTNDQNRAAPDELGELAGNRDGQVGGGYAQATLALDSWTHRPTVITAGVRVDAYHASGNTLLGIDPRLTFRFAPLDRLEFFGGFGQYTQPPSFPVPLPGIDTFALQLGLQRNVQGSVGIRVKMPLDLSASVTGYYGRFTNINDVIIDFTSSNCTSPPPESVTGLAAYITRQVSGAGYGMEVLLRRSQGRVTGWVSYTLSRAERFFSCGLAPSDFDQTHVLNTVVQVRLPWRLLLGGKLQLSTGRPYTQLGFDASTQTITGTRNNQRLPTYVQLDIRVDREWIFRRWALALFLEVLNLTYSESIYGITYPKDPTTMITRYDMPQFQGFQWVLPSIGARGRF